MHPIFWNRLLLSLQYVPSVTFQKQLNICLVTLRPDLFMISISTSLLLLKDGLALSLTTPRILTLELYSYTFLLKLLSSACVQISVYPETGRYAEYFKHCMKTYAKNKHMMLVLVLMSNTPPSAQAQWDIMNQGAHKTSLFSAKSHVVRHVSTKGSYLDTPKPPNV